MCSVGRPLIRAVGQADWYDVTTTAPDALRGYVNVPKYSVYNSQNESDCHLNTNKDIKVKLK